MKTIYVQALPGDRESHPVLKNYQEIHERKAFDFNE